MKVYLIFALLALAGCGQEVACMQYAPIPRFARTAAPPGETLLHRYQRTKKDYEDASALRNKVLEEFRDKPDTFQIVEGAYSAFKNAEDDMAKAGCGDVCK